MPEPEDWAATLAHDAGGLYRDSLKETLETAASYAVAVVRGCDAAGIVAVDRAGVRLLAASDATAGAVDRLQAELGVGPCFELGDGPATALRVADLDAAPSRWEPFTRAAAEMGIAGVMAVPLRVPGETLGILDVYSLRRDSLTFESESLGTFLAAHVAVAFAAARAGENLQAMMVARQEIGEAVGIVMERYGVTRSEAFAMLDKSAHDHHLRLRDLALRLVEQGAAPGII
jgi:GAF domain-containing protein